MKRPLIRGTLCPERLVSRSGITRLTPERYSTQPISTPTATSWLRQSCSSTATARSVISPEHSWRIPNSHSSQAKIIGGTSPSSNSRPSPRKDRHYEFDKSPVTRRPSLRHAGRFRPGYKRVIALQRHLWFWRLPDGYAQCRASTLSQLAWALFQRADVV